MKSNPFYLFILSLIFLSCTKDDTKFRLVPSSQSGIEFKNTLHSSVDFNILNYMYFYNGGGVATGDFNGDGLPDIYFVANQESNKLYLNKGNFKFQDVTELAGVEGFNGWDTGVTTADVNADGRLDIYVGFLGDYLMYKGKNQLFINEGNDENGVPRFRDRAPEYGLDLIGFATQAAFFDYDKDGDLDMIMVNHSLHEQGTFGRSALRTKPNPLSGDKLLRNDNGHFIDVTAESGIYSSVLGYGLGLSIGDVNLDGWPDIYIGNDFHEDDYLYLNRGDGTFVESLASMMPHTSRFSMGVDIGDINNDGYPEVMSTDMLPEKPSILKASSAEDAYDVYMYKLGYGYKHQFARNTLQLNNQDSTFSDIALFAGVGATDWSWSTLLVDLNLDGHKDIFIANGIPRRPNDLDYINFMQIDSIKYRMQMELAERDLKYIEKMPEIKLPNYLYVNNGDSTFANRAMEWGLEEESYSNSASYADFDNDGDLDLVTNNIEDEAFLFENRTIRENEKSPSSLKVVLKGLNGNLNGIGAKVILFTGGGMQMQECMPTRGFLGAVDYPLVFGPASEEIDSLIVIWNSGKFEKHVGVKANSTIVLNEKNAKEDFDFSKFKARSKLFKRTTDHLAINFKHRENRFVEFNREQLLPHMLSAEGPAAAIGDVDGDGLEDIFIGGGKWQEAALFTQQASGSFVRIPQPAISNDSTAEDVAAEFFDADNDKDLDLFVVSGGNEFFGKSKNTCPRLYRNNGKGQFEVTNQIEVFSIGSCVAVSDYDKDGDLDVFLGSRTTSRRYGVAPDSYILENDGKGNFKDITKSAAPELEKFGFVKHAIWTDIDNDQDDDLIIAAEWRAVSIFVNEGGKLSLMDEKTNGLAETNGWWNVLHAVDFDKDGDVDFVAGNLGENSKFKATVEQPVKMYVADFDKNDSIDQVVSYIVDGKEYPFHTRDELTKQMPFLKKRYLSYHKFANATVQEMFGEEVLEKTTQYVAHTFSSALIENLGNNKFQFRSLPSAAQLSQVNAILSDDFDKDGNVDVVLGGNFYPVNIQRGRYDAMYCLMLKGNGKNGFRAVPSVESGLMIPGETRSLRKIVVNGQVHYVAFRNDQTIEAFSLR